VSQALQEFSFAAREYGSSAARDLGIVALYLHCFFDRLSFRRLAMLLGRESHDPFVRRLAWNAAVSEIHASLARVLTEEAREIQSYREKRISILRDRMMIENIVEARIQDLESFVRFGIVHNLNELRNRGDVDHVTSVDMVSESDTVYVEARRGSIRQLRFEVLPLSRSNARWILKVSPSRGFPIQDLDVVRYRYQVTLNRFTWPEENRVQLVAATHGPMRRAVLRLAFAEDYRFNSPVLFGLSRSPDPDYYWRERTLQGRTNSRGTEYAVVAYDVAGSIGAEWRGRFPPL
jgi:hypothetical protein